MSDLTNSVKKKDRNTIDANDKFEVEYLHLQYPWYTTQQIKEVIQTAGPLYSHIDRELRHKHVTTVSK